MSVLDELIETYRALENVAAHGWQKDYSDPGRKRKKISGSFIKHDPAAVEKLASIERELVEIINFYTHWLRSRDLKVRGCNPGDDCTDLDFVCGHVIRGECGLGRKDKVEIK